MIRRNVAYDAAEFDRLLPPVEGTEHVKPEPEHPDEPPVLLDETAMRAWSGEDYKAKENGKIDRSASLLRIGRVLYDAGANRTVVIAALAERDATLGWRCYTDRKDADKQYHAIFDELAKNGRNGEVPFVPFTNSSNSSNSFSGEIGKTPAFPVDAMPRGTRQFIREAAASIDCPPELVALPVLTTVSAAIGHTRELQIKRSYSQSAALYGVGIAESGSGKSPAAEAATRPLKDIQVENKRTYREVVETYQTELRQYAVDKKRAEKDAEAEPVPSPPAKPVFRRTWVDNTTIEALAPKLEENPRGLGLFQDELTGWIRGFDQYKSGGKGDTRQQYIKMWANSTISIDRKTDDEPVILRRPYISIYGTIQPALVEELGTGREDGFVNRFLVVYPEPSFSRENDEEISLDAERSYETLIKYLYKLEPVDDSADEYSPLSVGFRGEARTLYQSYANRLADAAESPGCPTGMHATYPKLRAYLARISLIMATCREALGEGGIGITTEDVEAAWKLIQYFEAAAKKMYVQVNSYDREANIASELLSLLQSEGGSVEGTAEEFRKSLPSAPPTPEATSKLLRKVAKGTTLITFDEGWRRAADRNERVMRFGLVENS